MQVGTIFAVSVGSGRTGAAKLIAIDGDVLGIALIGWMWTCTPSPEVVDAAPRAIDHIAIRTTSLEDAVSIGVSDVAIEELEPGYRLWRAAPAGARTVTAAPVAALLEALVDTAAPTNE